MDLTANDAQIVLRTVRLQLARAKRNRCAIDVAELASRITRKHPRMAEAEWLRDAIAIQVARAGIPVYFSTPGWRS